MAMTSGRMPRPRITSFMVFTGACAGAAAAFGAVDAPGIGVGTPVATRVGTPVAMVVGTGGMAATTAGAVGAGDGAGAIGVTDGIADGGTFADAAVVADGSSLRATISVISRVVAADDA